MSQQHTTTTTTTSIDLESGGKIISECLKDAEEDCCSTSSCYSRHEFYSTYGGDGDGDGDGDGSKIFSRRASSSSSSSSDDCCSVPVHLLLQDDNSSRDCRICHLSVNGTGENEDAIELGCCCKHDLAVAHKHCALTWFQIKGNKTCEICNSIVSNLVVPNDMMASSHDVMMDVNPDSDPDPAAAFRGAHNIMSTRGGCINGHRLLNFILACLVFSFVISWLFRFNIPS